MNLKKRNNKNKFLIKSIENIKNKFLLCATKRHKYWDYGHRKNFVKKKLSPLRDLHKNLRNNI